MSLPAVLYVRDLRVMLSGWNSTRVRNFLIRNGLARFEPKRTAEDEERVYTTVPILAERMPDALAAFELKWEEAKTAKVIDPDDFSDLADDE